MVRSDSTTAPVLAEERHAGTRGRALGLRRNPQRGERLAVAANAGKQKVDRPPHDAGNRADLTGAAVALPRRHLTGKSAALPRRQRWADGGHLATARLYLSCLGVLWLCGLPGPARAQTETQPQKRVALFIDDALEAPLVLAVEEAMQAQLSSAGYALALPKVPHADPSQLPTGESKGARQLRLARKNGAAVAFSVDEGAVDGTLALTHIEVRTGRRTRRRISIQDMSPRGMAETLALVAGGMAAAVQTPPAAPPQMGAAAQTPQLDPQPPDAPADVGPSPPVSKGPSSAAWVPAPVQLPTPARDAPASSTDATAGPASAAAPTVRDSRLDTAPSGPGGPNTTDTGATSTDAVHDSDQGPTDSEPSQRERSPWSTARGDRAPAGEWSVGADLVVDHAAPQLGLRPGIGLHGDYAGPVVVRLALAYLPAARVQRGGADLDLRRWSAQLMVGARWQPTAWSVSALAGLGTELWMRDSRGTSGFEASASDSRLRYGPALHVALRYAVSARFRLQGSLLSLLFLNDSNYVTAPQRQVVLRPHRIVPRLELGLVYTH